MTNAKRIYNELLNDERLLELIDEDSIFDTYPNGVTVFPCVIFLDQNQREIEYADNFSTTDLLEVQIHIFTKAIENYPTTTEIGKIVNDIFKGDYWISSNNGEVPDTQDNIKHRVMNFSKKILVNL